MNTPSKKKKIERLHHAKVNLCDSINNTPTLLNSPSAENGLNYSIVENCIDEDNVKLKLKLSKTQQPTTKVLEPLNPNLMEYFHSPENNHVIMKGTYNIDNKDVDIISVDSNEEIIQKLRHQSKRGSTLRLQEPPTNVRRSSRTSTRISYSEYMSPSKAQLRSRDVDDEIINTTTPSKKINKGLNLSGKAADSFMSPTKLGFDRVTISSPALSTQFTTKQLKLNEEKAVKSSLPRKGDDYPPRRASTRKNKAINTDQVYDELEELLAPIINIKFTEKDREKSFATPKKQPRKTASARSVNQMLKNGEITPSFKNRTQKALHASTTPLNIVKEKLHVSYVPKALPCREKEYADIYNFVEGKLRDECGGCMYISGVPGTGKTATVSEVIRQLQTASKKKHVPDFIFVAINGMRLTEPRQAYVEILKQLTGKTHAWEQAQTMLEAKFTKAKSKKDGIIVVLLVDELDILCTKRQDVVYNLLDWPSKAKSQLIVITIANTMDLPERLLMGRVTSRLGLTRLTFQAYTHKQLQEIVMKRLLGTDAFKPDAVQLVARKVASVSGDARRALDICRRATEVAEMEGGGVSAVFNVSMRHVNEALNSMITQPKVRAIKCCSRLEQLMLQAIAAEVERTGVDETIFSDVYRMLGAVASIDGMSGVSITLALSAVKYLAACRLLFCDAAKPGDLHQRVILNVSADDIYYALRKD